MLLLMRFLTFAASVAGLIVGGRSEAPGEVTQDALETRDGDDLTPLNNYNGWVNPEDLLSMPQCIAQQDTAAWLSAMTQCTRKQCTRHFGLICTHHQWLTQLSCLDGSFSPALVSTYLPYCKRSVIAAAQLYEWINNSIDRTWMVDVGDSVGLQHLSPASLPRGPLDITVISYAPQCLTTSASTGSQELFEHVLASCSFTRYSKHTGNVARPWEYNEGLASMTALDSEIASYERVGWITGSGDYFDRACFCNSFTLDTSRTCLPSVFFDDMKSLLWINATCGPASLPNGWENVIRTTQSAYISLQIWTWPQFFSDTPKDFERHRDECLAYACVLNARGYCTRISRSVSRACFCHKINYDTCGESCHIFENRIEYINWLHNLCGSVENWSGLPNNWAELAGVISSDMVPWNWRVVSLNEVGRQMCSSTKWKLGNMAFASVVPLILAPFLARGCKIYQLSGSILGRPHPGLWLITGSVGGGLELLANYLNAVVVHGTPGFGHVPVDQLMSLWSTRPRLGWLMLLLAGGQPSQTTYLSAAAAALIAEVIPQLVSWRYMEWTADYARQHKLYLGVTYSVQRGESARAMYAGALLWLIVVGPALIVLIAGAFEVNKLIMTASRHWKKWKKPKLSIAKTVNLKKIDAMTARQAILAHAAEIETVLQYMDHLRDTKDFWLDDTRNVNERHWYRLKDRYSSCADHWTDLINAVDTMTQDEKSISVSLKGTLGVKNLNSIQEKHLKMTHHVESMNVQRHSPLHVYEQQRALRSFQQQMLKYKEQRVTQLSALYQHANKYAADVAHGAECCRDSRTAAVILADRVILNQWVVLYESLSQLEMYWKNLARHWQNEIESVKAATQTDIKPSKVPRSYGTIGAPVIYEKEPAKQKRYKWWSVIVCSSMLLVNIAQWLFWGGFIGLASEEYCPPKLDLITGIWIVFSTTGAVIGAII